jgi:GWxTD domain-containing protein
MGRLVWLLLILAPLLRSHAGAAAAEPLPSKSEIDATVEDLDRVLERWRREFVAPIITPEEARLFDSLLTREQRLAFVEQFWRRRDPTPGTEENEFRARYLERFMNAGRLFRCGKPGWQTDRGRIYILLGPPTTVTRNPMGRGSTEHPSEIWTYDGLPGVELPSSLDVVFVDFSGTGDFKLVSNLDMNARFLTDAGPITAPLQAYAYYRSGHALLRGTEDYALTSRLSDPARLLDDEVTLLERLRSFATLGGAQLDAALSERVTTNVSFRRIPLLTRVHQFPASSGYTTVLFNLGLAPRELKRLEDGSAGFDLFLTLEREGRKVEGLHQQHRFRLEPEDLDALLYYDLGLLVLPGRYTYRLVLLDVQAHNIGTVSGELQVQAFPAEGLVLAEPVLVDRLAPAPPEDGPQARETPLLLGDSKVVARLRPELPPGTPLQVFLLAYGAALDPADGLNRLSLEYEIRRDGRSIRRFEDLPIQRSTDRNTAIYNVLPLTDLEPGTYELVASVHDSVQQSSSSRTTSFTIAPPPREAAPRP